MDSEIQPSKSAEVMRTGWHRACFNRWMCFSFKWAVLCSMILFPMLLCAEDIYIAQNALGTDSGSDAANAHSAVWLNTKANWGEGETKISAGDTVHLVGTITNSLSAHGGGVLGSVIKIQFEAGSKLSSPRFSPAALILDNNKFITVDAVIPSAIHIENTANGTGLSQQAGSIGISAQNIESVIIQNLTITNLYKRAFGSSDGTRQGIGINASGNNLTIQSNRIYEGDTLIGFNYGPIMTSNLVIRANTLKRMNHGIAIGGHQANNTLVNVNISGNIIDDLDVWDGNAGLHLDGMIIFNEAPDYSGYISNMVIHANLIGPNIGKMNTAAIFLDAYQIPQFRNVKIYNNVFTWRMPYSWSNGAVEGSGSNLLIANNTFVGWANENGDGNGIAIGSAVSKIYNNLFLHCGTRISNGGYSVASFNAADFDSDYNVFSKPSTGTGDFCVPGYRLQSYVGWTNGMAADIKRFVDKNSVTNMPLVNANYAPISGDTVLNRGTNLSVFFVTDFAGQSRPALGSWTIGAYQGSVSSLLSPPSGLRLTR